jgi:dolichol-phosphate mannosyltransferase
LFSFSAACGVGAVINFGLAQLLLFSGLPWYLAGFAGMVVSSVWNFAVTAMFTWRWKRRAAMFPQSIDPLVTAHVAEGRADI